jgi:hypothetical protein
MGGKSEQDIKPERDFGSVFATIRASADDLVFPVSSFAELADAIGTREVAIGRMSVPVSKLGNIIPARFFPLASREDFEEKLTELSQSRAPLTQEPLSVPHPITPRKIERPKPASRRHLPPLAGGAGGGVATGAPNVIVDWVWWNQNEGQVLWTFVNTSAQQCSVILFRDGYYFGGAFWPLYIKEGFGLRTTLSSLGGNLFGPYYMHAPLGLVHFAGQAYIVVFIFTLDPGEAWGTVESGFTGKGGQPTEPEGPLFAVEVEPEGGATNFCLQYDPQQVADYATTASNSFGSSSPAYEPNPNTFDFLPFKPVQPISAFEPFMALYPADVVQRGNCGSSPFWYFSQSLGDPPGNTISGPGVCSWAPDRRDVFVRGTDDALWHRWYASDQFGIGEIEGWAGWESLWGTLASDPCAVSWGENRIDVFVMGPDRSLRHICFDTSLGGYEGGWRDWESLSAPETAAWDGTPAQTEDDGWQTLSPAQGYGLVSKPAAISWGPNSLRVFVYATTPGSATTDLWFLSFEDGVWTQAWEKVQVPLNDPFEPGSSPAVVAWENGRIDIVAQGKSALWHLAYAWGWQAWENLFTVVAAPIVGFERPQSPAVSSWAPGRLDVFALEERPMGAQGDSAMWHLWFDGGSWQHWEALGGQFNSDPCAISASANTIDVFARGTQLDLQHFWWG